MEIFGYRKLIAYQKAKEVVKITYKYIKKFPSDERFALSDQLRRSSVSITSNIAEGINRYSAKDKAHQHVFSLVFKNLINSKLKKTTLNFKLYTLN